VKRFRNFELALGFLLATALWGGVFIWQSQRPLQDSIFDRPAEWLIALFTGTLWYSTRNLWRATRRSARIAERALTELEAPFVSIKITDPGVHKKNAEIGHDFMTIWFCIANHGRTPARLIELVDKLALLENGKDWPREVHPDAATRNTMPYGVIAPPNGESPPFSNNLFAFMMNALAADPLPLKTKNFFFYGFVRYSTIFDEVFRMGFCYMFDRYSDKWLLFGDDKFNYCRKERSSQNS
jgi:hypothetical protein